MIMDTQSTRPARPNICVQIGLVLSALRQDARSDLLTTQIAVDGIVQDVLAPSSAWLSEALDGPVVARALRLITPTSPDLLSWLLEAPIDSLIDGFWHLPATICPIEGTIEGIQNLTLQLETAPLRDFLMAVFQRRDVFQSFWTMPASAAHHHSYAGGLALHSLEVAQDIASNAGLSDTERELGIVGALMHDIGKVWSYTQDMYPNTANLAMGHELVGLSRLEPELAALEAQWPDGAYAMRTLLSGNSRKRSNDKLPISLLARIKACDQRSCEQDHARNPRRRATSQIWLPQPWQASSILDGIDLW